MNRRFLRSNRYARRIPRQLMQPLALPLGRQMNTSDAFRWESVRMLHTAFGYVANEGVTGDYAEFGVCEGHTFLEAWLASRHYKLENMQFHAYDSFAGLPEPTGVDSQGPFEAGQYARPRSTFDEITQEVEADRVTVTEGFFDDVLPAAERHRIAVAWIDCDLYQSTVPVLDFLTDQLQDGSVLIFDDWFCFHGRPDRGERRACQEWLAAHPSVRLVEYRDFHWAGQSFIVNRYD